MIDDLIPFYQRELNFLRESAAGFAQAHPKIASRLELAKEPIGDPHVGRVIEAVAFMNARLRHKLEDEFSEVSDALLETLYPHLIAPVPSFMVGCFEPSPDLATPMTIPRGTAVEAQTLAVPPCRYQTAADLCLLPLRLTGATMASDPYPRPAGAPRGTKGVLQLELAGITNEVDLRKIETDRLRFYLRGDPRKAHILVEQFGANLLGIAVARDADDESPAMLPPDALRNIGLDEGGLLLPQRDYGLWPYAILQEFFAYPQKHLFFEVSGLRQRTRTLSGNALSLFFFFDRLSPELERVIGTDDIAIHAVPMINLFEAEREPVRLDQTLSEYRLSPGIEVEHLLEIHSVTAMELIAADGTRETIPPLYDVEHVNRPGALFYATQRRTSFGAGGGDDLFVSVADREGRLMNDPDAKALPTVLAFNRNLPPFTPGGAGPKLETAETINGVVAVQALTAPTPPRRPRRRREAIWKLISQLSLNHLSYSSGPAGAAALREILGLYDLADSRESIALRERLGAVTSAPDVARTRVAGHQLLCAGTAIELMIHDQRLAGNGSFALCAVIERFLALTASLNSFVRVSARLEHDSQSWKTWQPRAGDRDLV